MSDEPRDAFEAILGEATEGEAEMIAHAQASVRGCVSAELDQMLPALRTLRRNAAAAFWNQMANEVEAIIATIERDRDTFGSLWASVATELEHMAALKERITTMSKQGDTDGPVH